MGPMPAAPAAPVGSGPETRSRLTPFSPPGSRGVSPPHTPTPTPGAENAASPYKSRRLRVRRARRRLLPSRGQAAAAVPRGSAVGRPEDEPEAPVWAWDWLSPQPALPAARREADLGVRRGRQGAEDLLNEPLSLARVDLSGFKARPGVTEPARGHALHPDRSRRRRSYWRRSVTRPCPCKWQLLWGLSKQSELSIL